LPAVLKFYFIKSLEIYRSIFLAPASEIEIKTGGTNRKAFIRQSSDIIDPVGYLYQLTGLSADIALEDAN